MEFFFCNVIAINLQFKKVKVDIFMFALKPRRIADIICYGSSCSIGNDITLTSGMCRSPLGYFAHDAGFLSEHLMVDKREEIMKSELFRSVWDIGEIT